MIGFIKESTTKPGHMKKYFTPAVFAFTVLAVSSFFFVNGCKKDEDVDTETTSATDNNLCETEFLRLMPTVNQIAIDEGGVHRYGSGGGPHTASCPTITVDTANSFPVIMTIDYGTGCADPVDGKVRKGKLICEISESWDSVGCITSIMLDSFYVGAIRYEGTVTFERLSANSFRKTVASGHCSKSGSTPWDIYFDSDKTITFVSGANNSSQTQIVRIEGTNHGTDRNGQEWTCNITSPIIRDLSCTWITQGTLELTPTGKSMRTVDFGSGNCDNKGTVTIDGNTFEFTMQ